MCVIAVKEKGVAWPSHADMQRCFTSNPDGGGLAWFDGKKMWVKKGYFSWKEMWKDMKTIEEYPVIFHTRIATHGSVEYKNCHPFLLKNNVALAHNGVIHGMTTRANQTDTQAFAQQYIEPLKSSFIFSEGEDSAAFRGLVEKGIGSYNKMAMMNTKGKIIILNRSAGVEYQGLWFSNNSYAPKAYTPTTVYHHDYSSWGGYDYTPPKADLCVFSIGGVCENEENTKEFGTKCSGNWKTCPTFCTMDDYEYSIYDVLPNETDAQYEERIAKEEQRLLDLETKKASASKKVPNVNVSKKCGWCQKYITTFDYTTHDYVTLFCDDMCMEAYDDSNPVPNKNGKCIRYRGNYCEVHAAAAGKCWGLEYTCPIYSGVDILKVPTKDTRLCAHHIEGGKCSKVITNSRMSCNGFDITCNGYVEGEVSITPALPALKGKAV